MLGRVQVSFTLGQGQECVHEHMQASREGSGESAAGHPQMHGHLCVALGGWVKVAKSSMPPLGFPCWGPEMQCQEGLDFILGMFCPDLATTIESTRGACPAECAVCS